MKNKIIYLLLFFSLFASCTKDPGTSGCGPVKDIYFRFTDTFATSLVDVYKQGDTLKLKHNSGTIYYFIAQKPDTGYGFEKPVTGGSCDGDNFYLQYYKLELKPTVKTLPSIFVKVFYEYGRNSASDYFRVDFSNSYYYKNSTGIFPPPPSKLYIDSLKVNNFYYYNVQKLESINGSSEPSGLLYYNRKNGLIKIAQFNNEYELQP